MLRFPDFVDPYRMAEEIESMKHPFFEFKCQVEADGIIVECRCKDAPDVKIVQFKRFAELSSEDDYMQIAFDAVMTLALQLLGFSSLDERLAVDEIKDYAVKSGKEHGSEVQD